MRIIAAVLITLLVALLGVTSYTTHQARQYQEQITLLQSELNSLQSAQVVQDTVVAYFAEVWPDIHVMRVEGVPEHSGLLSVYALAGAEVINMQCVLSSNGISHNLGDVLRDKIGSLLLPIATLSDEPGGQGSIAVNAPAGMRTQIKDVVGSWAHVIIEGKQGYLPLWFVSLRSPSFYMRPFSQTGHNPQDRLGRRPDSLLSSYFSAYTSGDFINVAKLHAHSPYQSQEQFVGILEQERVNGYRIWGYEVLGFEMIDANHAAVLVNYSYNTSTGRTAVLSEWWRVVREDGLWKVSWMVRQW